VLHDLAGGPLLVRPASREDDRPREDGEVLAFSLLVLATEEDSVLEKPPGQVRLRPKLALGVQEEGIFAAWREPDGGVDLEADHDLEVGVEGPRRDVATEHEPRHVPGTGGGDCPECRVIGSHGSPSCKRLAAVTVP
jgi:hypothetical protein